MTYKFKSGSRFKGDAQVVGEALDQIRKSSFGLTAQSVVAAAVSESSPLHGYFEWDDEAAAGQYREVQARELIRSVEVITEKTEPTRAFSLVVIEGGKPSYTSTLEALNDEDLRHQILMRASKELAAFRTKYAKLSELSDVFEALDQFNRQFELADATE